MKSYWNTKKILILCWIISIYEILNETKESNFVNTLIFFGILFFFNVPIFIEKNQFFFRISMIG